MRPPSDFVSAARRNALAHGDERGFTFVREQRARGPRPVPGETGGPAAATWGRGYREETLGFAELDRRARGLAVLLEERGLRDRDHRVYDGLHAVGRHMHALPVVLGVRSDVHRDEGAEE